MQALVPVAAFPISLNSYVFEITFTSDDAGTPQITNHTSGKQPK